MLLLMDIPRLSRIEFHILELLVEHGQPYALEMVRASSRLKRGTVYVTLRRMEDKGYVESWPEKSEFESGLPRRRYRMTGHGARLLAAWQQADRSYAAGPAT